MGVISEMREVSQQRRPDRKGKMVWAGHWYNRLLTRHISIYFTWVFVKLGISANGATFLMLVAGLIGASLLIPHTLWVTILSAVVLCLVEILDCVDGEIARWTRKTSLRGTYLDGVSHVLCNHLAKAVCALHLYVWQRDVKFLILAFVAYGISISEHGVRKCYAHAMNKVSPEQAEAIKPKRATAGLRMYARKAMNLAYSIPGDAIVIKVIALVVIFLSYAGYVAPMVWVSWILPAAGVIVLIILIVQHYFFMIPDLPSQKKV